MVATELPASRSQLSARSVPKRTRQSPCSSTAWPKLGAASC